MRQILYTVTCDMVLKKYSDMQHQIAFIAIMEQPILEF